MPLAFETANRGTIAVGFFNVETDMVMVGRYLLFASDLCVWVTGHAAESRPDFSEERAVWEIEPSAMGDLHGAMEGRDLSGFLGEIYGRYPFPKQREEFHQKPWGWKTREIVTEIVGRYTVEQRVLLAANSAEETFVFGEYLFTQQWWRAVVDYLWRGGLPRWQDEERPGYVLDMGRALERSEQWLFRV